MGKRVFTLLTALSLLLVGAPAATVQAAMTPDPAFVNSGLAFVPTICQNGYPENYQAGEFVSSPNHDMQGVKGILTSNIGLCLDPTPNEGSSIWVGLEPRSCGFPCIPENAIVQIGLINNGNGLHYFWSAGGCGTAVPGTNLLPGSPSFLTPYSFRIEEDANNFYLYWPGGSVAIIAKSQSGLSCWAYGQLNAHWIAEVHDYATSYGSSSHPSNVTDMEFRMDTTGSQWDYLKVGYGDCPIIPVRSKPTTCHTFTGSRGDNFNVYD